MENNAQGWEAYISGRPGVMQELRNRSIWREVGRGFHVGLTGDASRARLIRDRLQEGRD